MDKSISDKQEAGILPRFSYFIIRHTEVARAEAERRSRSRLMRVRIAEVSHNFFYFMRFFAFAQNDVNPCVVDCYVTASH